MTDQNSTQSIRHKVLFGTRQFSKPQGTVRIPYCELHLEMRESIVA